MLTEQPRDATGNLPPATSVVCWAGRIAVRTREVEDAGDVNVGGVGTAIHAGEPTLHEADAIVAEPRDDAAAWVFADGPV